MHKNAMDVAVEVTDSGLIQALCKFINLGYSGKPFYTGPLFQLPIVTFNDTAWVPLSVNDLTIIRTKSGLPK